MTMKFATWKAALILPSKILILLANPTQTSEQ
jgi:hypothetical protein